MPTPPQYFEECNTQGIRRSRRILWRNGVLLSKTEESGVVDITWAVKPIVLTLYPIPEVFGPRAESHAKRIVVGIALVRSRGQPGAPLTVDLGTCEQPRRT